MQFAANLQLGPKRFKTREGFLLCMDVPVARTGDQTYYCTEIPTIHPRPDGIITVHREPEEVFAPATIASFEGKDVTDTHPSIGVTPETWGNVSKGHMQNVRRGQGMDAMFLMADLLVKDADLIGKIERGEVREVSCGYDCDYEEISPGFARQKNIRGNHVALVLKGRAGPVCAIQDEENPMTTATAAPAAQAAPAITFAGIQVPKIFRPLLRAIRTGDADEVEEKMQDSAEEMEKLQKDNEDLTAKLAAADAEIAELKAAAEKSKTDDNGGLINNVLPTVNNSGNQGVLMTGDALNELLAKAEIVSPGVKLSTTDAAGAGNGDRLMRAALTAAASHAAIKDFVAGKDLAKLSGPALVATFDGAHALMVMANKGITKPGFGTFDAKSSVALVTDMNAKAAAGWGARRNPAALGS